MRALLLAVFLAALAGIVAAVDGPSVRDMCNGECPLKAEAVTVTPYPPVKGSVATLNVRGELSGASVEGGTIITTTYYKVARSMSIIASPSQLIFWVKGKTTNNDTCDPGRVNETIRMTVPEELPAGSYKTILEVNDASSNYIGHFEILFQVKDNDNVADTFNPIMRERLAVGLQKVPRKAIKGGK